MHPEHSPSAYPQQESTRDVLDVLASGIAKMAASENKHKPKRRRTVPTEPTRELLTEKMLADR